MEEEENSKACTGLSYICRKIIGKKRYVQEIPAG
jgi:hypothetical protein